MIEDDKLESLFDLREVCRFDGQEQRADKICSEFPEVADQFQDRDSKLEIHKVELDDQHVQADSVANSREVVQHPSKVESIHGPMRLVPSNTAILLVAIVGFAVTAGWLGLRKREPSISKNVPVTKTKAETSHSSEQDDALQFDLIKPTSSNVFAETDFIRTVRLSADGNTVAVIVSGLKSVIRVYERTSHQLNFEISFYDPLRNSSALYVEDMAFSPDGATLAIGGDGFIRMVYTESSAVRWESKAFEGPLAITPDGKRLVALRNPRDLIQVMIDENLADKIIGDLAKLLNVGTVKDPSLADRFAYPTGNEHLLELLGKDPGNKPLIESIEEQALGAFVVLNAATGKFQRVLDVEADFTNKITMHPIHSILAVSRQGIIELLNVDTGKLIKSIKVRQPKISSVTFDSNGKRLLFVDVARNSVAIINVESSMIVVGIEEIGQSVLGAIFSPNGRRIVTCGIDGKIRVWDAETAAELYEIQASKLPLYSVDGVRCCFASCFPL